jgi:hypothetical protein
VLTLRGWHNRKTEVNKNHILFKIIKYPLRK